MEGPRPPVALYVHVPFCVGLCPYCDFVVYTGRSARGRGALVGRFVEALAVEQDLRADAADDAFGTPCDGGRPPLRSVYLGGGTPSLLPAASVERLLRRAEARFGLAADAEITIEANPGPDERGDLAGFRAAGANRLSLGAQSLGAAELRALGRRHRPEDVVNAVREARSAGFDDVSLDLLYDVPGQTVASWERTLRSVLALDLPHVSAYALTLDDPDGEGLTGPTGDHLPVRAGARRWRERARSRQDDDRAAAMYALAEELLDAAGLRWYELSNWARPGYESRHNLAYWRREPYEALGPGAHAFDGAGVRRWNAARLDRYLAALLPPDGGPASLPPGGSEMLDEGAQFAEAALLGLRTAQGIAEPTSTVAPVREALAWGRASGLVEADASGRAVLSLRGRLLSNELFARLV